MFHETGITTKINASAVIRVYEAWAEFSRISEFSGMFSLVKPGSLFDELTKSCSRINETGIQYRYVLKNIKVAKLNGNSKEAYVTGTIVLDLFGSDEKYKGIFQSTCIFEKNDSNWLLDDIEIEWE
jgi:hypothetical protein